MRFMRSLDAFGYKMRLTYQGAEAYQSWPGGLLSVLVGCLTILVVINGLNKVINMTEPQITAFYKPLTEEERQSIKSEGLNFAEYDFNILINV